MKREKILLAAILLVSQAVFAGSVTDILDGYSREAGVKFEAAEGNRLWEQVGKEKHTCANCHGDDLKQPGKHARTGKKIEPMALSVNRERFTDRKKIEKWFKRNCKWTWGRECTAQEKGHLLTWLSSQ